MNTTAVDADMGTAQPYQFVRALDQTLCCLINMVNAINCRNYESAWLMACDLGRAVVHAEVAALQLGSSVDRALALARLAGLRVAVMRVMQSAPRPSPLAIAQARCTTPGLDRSAWAFDEQQWIDARASGEVLQITFEGDSLMLRSVSTIGAN